MTEPHKTPAPPPTAAPHIYVPEDRDDLRDGIYRGYYAHLTPPQTPPERKP